MSATLYSEGSDLNAVIAEIGQRHAGAATVVSLEEHRQGGVLGFFARKAYGITYEVDDTVEAEELAAEETVTVTAGPATANPANTADSLDELLEIAEQTERSLEAARRPAALAAPAQAAIGSLPAAPVVDTTNTDEPDFAATLQAIAAAREAARESGRDGRRPRHYAPDDAAAQPTVEAPAPADTVETIEVATAAADTGMSAESAQWIAQQAEAKRVEAMLMEAQRAHAERAEAQRAEEARLEAARAEAARIEAARVEAARVEAARAEAARVEAEKREAEKREAALLEAARIEAARIEAARIEAARVEAERVEAERVAAEKREAEKREIMRAAAEKLAAEKLAAEVAAAEQEAAERAAAELFQQQLHEAALIEADRVEASRIEAERIEADRAAAARIAAQKLEAERIEAVQRAEAQRIEAARINAARMQLARDEKLRNATESAAKSAPAFEPLHPRVAPATAQIIPAIGAETTAIPEPAVTPVDEKVSEPKMGMYKHEKKKGKKNKALRRGAAMMQASQHLGAAAASAETPMMTPVVEAPAVAAPAAEMPVVEMPVVEAPAAQVPVVEEAPLAPVAHVEAAVVETPTVETPIVVADPVESTVVAEPATNFIEPSIIEIAEEQVPAAQALVTESVPVEATVEIEADVVTEVDIVIEVETQNISENTAETVAEVTAEEVSVETVADVVAEVDVVNGTVIDINRVELRHAAPEPETPEEPTEAPAPEVAPIVDDCGDTASQLRELGVPTEMLNSVTSQDVYRAVRQLSLALAAAPTPPSGAGEILVLVGPLIATLRAGRALATELRLPAESLRVVTTNPDFPLKQSAGSVAQAALAAATIRVSGGVGIIVVDTELDDAPMMVTANGATIPANVVGEVLAAIAPTTVWAVTDASRKTADIRNWLDAMPAVHALVVHDAWKSSTPATVWSLGVPVALLDGRPASAGAWSALLIDRIERDDVAASA
ncbi:hypothetical protein SAMN05444157_0334 [Frankineae bacterium MT45]|nr:hypothetical protein SAMN05444157_0334 [Frankineae bacterium MT45]